MDETKFKSYVNTVLDYAQSQPSAAACTFQKQGPETAKSISYKQLKQSVESRAELLISKGLVGKNVALIFPSGIEFVIDFLACLLAGSIAVPLNLSRNKQQLGRTLGVLQDANAVAVLTLSETEQQLQNILAEMGDIRGDLIWLTENTASSDIASVDKFKEVNAEDLAFIQYTSGSTSEPKGVMVTHGNIVDNQESIRKACQHKHGLIAGGWLPQFHDMGLIGHMLQPLYMGGHYVFMPPLNFIQRPRRWLELISHYRIASSASPNFGYEHCLRFISEREDLSHIDLSCWRIALNGSEPVNAKTMLNFAQRFKQLGFNEKSFFPCYGMAETTLFVSGGPAGSGVKTDPLDPNRFEKGVVARRVDEANKVSVVSCGQISEHFRVRIVNPHTGIVCRPDEIGEIWLSGKSIAKGYWNNPGKTQETFQAKPIGEDNAYMRTGDMGYVRGGELFVTGRIKEMLIVRGRNLYPYDIERTCNEHPKASGSSAVITFDSQDNQECRLIAFVELTKQALLVDNLEDIEAELRERVAKTYEVTLDSIYLLKPGTIPKTTSGKIKRTACKSLVNQLKSETTLN